MRIGGIPFYPAASTNYTKGRSKPVRKLTIHHSAGWEGTLRYLWADPNRNGSSTFWVGNLPGQMEQYVDTADTPWTNGNFDSNSESLTVETRGDWRGYYDRGTLDNLYNLMLKLLPHWPHLVLEFHQDVSRVFTLCPADLKHKGYARAEFDRAVAAFNKPAPAPTPAPTAISYRKITPKRVKLNKVANLWNFNFNDWSKAQSVATHGAGHLVDVVAVAKNALGAEYYMTAYSYNDGKIRSTNGFNVKDCDDYVPQVTQTPTVELKWEPMLTPRKMRLLTDTRVTELNMMVEVGDVIKAGTDIALVDKKTVAPGKVYVRSQWAKENGKNWGMPLDRFTEVPSPKPEPPREPIPEPPLDVDPTKPGSGDIEVRLGAIEKFLAALGFKK